MRNKEDILREFDKEIENLKDSLGNIPEDSCPDIDKIIKEHSGIIKELEWLDKNSNKYDNIDDFVKDFPSYWNADVESISEVVRDKNSRLREIGKEWYEFAKWTKQFLSSVIDELQSNQLEVISKSKCECEVDWDKVKAFLAQGYLSAEDNDEDEISSNQIKFLKTHQSSWLKQRPVVRVEEIKQYECEGCQDTGSIDKGYHVVPCPNCQPHK